MAAETKLFDYTLGVGSHGYDCCPHTIIGIRITGSLDVFVDALPTSRSIGDIALHDCPHCPINMCITGSPNVFSDCIVNHRVGDTVTEFCGMGVTITGSRDTIDN